MTNEKYIRPREIYQRVRCLKCQTRINVELEQRQVCCPKCNEEWKIMWVTPDLPIISRRVRAAFYRENK
jgi:Zn finger protein HypA/HybF involved in hydrogenase expression